MSGEENEWGGRGGVEDSKEGRAVHVWPFRLHVRHFFAEVNQPFAFGSRSVYGVVPTRYISPPVGSALTCTQWVELFSDTFGVGLVFLLFQARTLEAGKKKMIQKHPDE